MQVIHEVKHDTSAPLRSLPAAIANPATLPPHLARPVLKPGIHPAGPAQPDTALQTTHLPYVSATLGLNFDGLGNNQYGFVVTGAPPDTEGAVGATQYVQWVNTSFAVFDKTTGALLMGPTSGNALWSGFGGGCQNNNDGDPVVVYDQMANRWVFSQFSVSTTPFLQCVAVSTTNDATGSYNRYAFQLPNFNDYPKMGVWPDAYYFAFNMFNAAGTTFFGADACAANRTAMLAGSAATMICFQQSSSVDSLLPSDMDGNIVPTIGEPNFFMDFTTNALRMWKFHVDFTTPSNSTFTGPTTLAVASFSQLCGGGTCVPQPSTTTQLDSLGDRLMYRLAWRKFPDGHEALVVTHSISTGIRWYEVRNPNGTPTVFQQGTFAPTAATRWMGSIAMDQAGDIGLGYSQSSSTVHPSVFITGRVPSDPAGSMETEMSVVSGTGSQTSSTSFGQLTRWGDYSAMTIDPTDDCTFWYTQEYMKTTGIFNWNTRIASFKFPGCGVSAPVVSLSPTSLNFGTKLINTTTAAKIVTLTNTGTATLNISSITTNGDFAKSATTCGATVAAGASCTVSVTFTPTAINTRTGTLTFNDDASNSPQNVPLTGVGTEVQLSAASLSFARTVVGQSSATKTETITNKGSTAMTFTSISIIGTNPGDFVIVSNTCGSTLAAAANCAVGVQFKPTAINARKATLSIADNGGGSPQNVPLSGTGTILAISPLSWNYGTHTVGTSTANAFTLTNDGTVSITFTGFSITGTNPSDYLITGNTCGSSLAIAANCIVTVTFKPTATGTRKANLSISDNAGGSPQLEALTGTGQ